MANRVRVGRAGWGGDKYLRDGEPERWVGDWC